MVIWFGNSTTVWEEMLVLDPKILTSISTVYVNFKETILAQMYYVYSQSVITRITWHLAGFLWVYDTTTFLFFNLCIPYEKCSIHLYRSYQIQPIMYIFVPYGWDILLLLQLLYITHIWVNIFNMDVFILFSLPISALQWLVILLAFSQINLPDYT